MVETVLSTEDGDAGAGDGLAEETLLRTTEEVGTSTEEQNGASTAK